MLKTRVLTALVLLVVFLTALFRLPAMAWLALAVLMVGAAGFEWGRLAGLSRAGTTVLIAVLAGGLLVLAHEPRFVAWACMASVAFWVGVAPVWLKYQWHLKPAASGVLAVSLLLPAGLALVRLRELGPFVVLAIMVLVWVADSAAYFTGRAFGRHKLAPTVSPGKTWEGAAGAVVGVLVAGFLLNRYASANGMPALNASWLVPQLLLITAVSIIGDLFESMLKRQAGAKDSGTLLPGHGGVLDRIDSLISTLPLGLVLLTMNLP